MATIAELRLGANANVVFLVTIGTHKFATWRLTYGGVSYQPFVIRISGVGSRIEFGSIANSETTIELENGPYSSYAYLSDLLEASHGAAVTITEIMIDAAGNASSDSDQLFTGYLDQMSSVSSRKITVHASDPLTFKARTFTWPKFTATDFPNMDDGVGSAWPEHIETSSNAKDWIRPIVTDPGVFTAELAADMTATGTAISFTGGQVFVGGTPVVYVGSEQIRLDAWSSSYYTCTRGYNGTLAAAHSAGATAYKTGVNGQVFITRGAASVGNALCTADGEERAVALTETNNGTRTVATFPTILELPNDATTVLEESADTNLSWGATETGQKNVTFPAHSATGMTGRKITFEVRATKVALAANEIKYLYCDGQLVAGFGNATPWDADGVRVLTVSLTLSAWKTAVAFVASNLYSPDVSIEVTAIVQHAQLLEHHAAVVEDITCSVSKSGDPATRLLDLIGAAYAGTSGLTGGSFEGVSDPRSALAQVLAEAGVGLFVNKLGTVTLKGYDAWSSSGITVAESDLVGRGAAAAFQFGYTEISECFNKVNARYRKDRVGGAEDGYWTTATATRTPARGMGVVERDMTFEFVRTDAEYATVIDRILDRYQYPLLTVAFEVAWQYAALRIGWTFLVATSGLYNGREFLCVNWQRTERGTLQVEGLEKFW